MAQTPDSSTRAPGAFNPIFWLMSLSPPPILLRVALVARCRAAPPRITTMRSRTSDPHDCALYSRLLRDRKFGIGMLHSLRWTLKYLLKRRDERRAFSTRGSQGDSGGSGAGGSVAFGLVSLRDRCCAFSSFDCFSSVRLLLMLRPCRIFAPKPLTYRIKSQLRCSILAHAQEKLPYLKHCKRQ